MILLKRLELINWHNFNFDIVDFGVVNFLTGKNASGKTTIIDAVQLIMLGDTSGHFFNKSASDKSARTLNGYLRCEIGTDEYGNPTYKRKGHFYSYVVTEFYDDVNLTPFVLGIVFENYDDASFAYRFFTYDGPIPESNFMNKGYPIGIKDLTFHVYSQTEKTLTFFDTNTSYREFIRQKFGNIASNFFSLFKKAIPFAPISNIETFINEYVVDVSKEIDLDVMQESIRKYTGLEMEAALLEKRLARLDEINQHYNTWKENQDKYMLKRYVYARADKAAVSNQLDNALEQVRSEQEDLNAYQTYLFKAQEKIKSLEEKRSKLIEEKLTSNDVIQKANLERDLLSLEKQLQEINNDYSWAKTSLFEFYDSWSRALTALLNTHQHDKTSEIYLRSNELLKEIDVFKLQKEKTLDEKSLIKVQTLFNHLKSIINQSRRDLEFKLNGINEELKHIEAELSYLSAGKKSYDKKLLILKELLEDKLEAKFKQKVSVEILADILEVKDEKWRRVIETYLGAQRFYLFVEPKYVDEAIKIYDQVKNEYEINDIGIVDTEKIAALKPQVDKDALSEEIETDNKYARIYIDNSLGTLIKASSVDTLRQYRRSVTSSGMLYQNYVARQLNLNRTQLYIGSGVIDKSLEERKILFSKAKENRDDHFRVLSSYEGFNSVQALSQNEVMLFARASNNANKVDIIEEEIKNIRFKLQVFGSNEFIVHIEKNIARVESDLADLRAEELGFTSSISKSKQIIENSQTQIIPSLKASLKEKEDNLRVNYNDPKVKVQGETLYLEEMEKFKTIESLFASYGPTIGQIDAQLSKDFSKIIELRAGYNSEYHTDFENIDRSNDDYQNEYDTLVTNSLVDYKSKIKQAKEVAMWQFKDNFLAKLKSNFDMVNFQISNLNFALSKARFGNDSYTFTVTPKLEYRRFYEMINDPLLLEGKEIFSAQFQEKYQDRLEELFSYITAVDHANPSMQSEIEQNISRYTDYRNYLKFDLEVVDINGNKQQLSKTLLKKSGGETQTPFYISILASFSQLYKILEGSDKSNTVRLIVFDEAFSKMDSERIQESVRLLRNYSLQAIISAPPEKMPDVVPHVDETLLVVRHSDNSHIYNYKKEESLVK